METIAQPSDIAVIGAGLSGLISAQLLQQAGYRVVVVDKSRGLGGRLATRRLHDTCADHGVRSLTIQGALSQQLIQTLEQQQLLHPWAKPIYRSDNGVWTATETVAYGSSTGLNAVAKWLAQDLEIRRDQRVEAIVPISNQWQIQCEPTQTKPVLARALVVAIPAPQALPLLEPLQTRELPPEVVTALRTVDYDPCITVIATYEVERQAAWNSLPWQALQIENSADLAWISLETSKYPSRHCSVAVIQSTAAFARQWFDTADLQSVGQRLVQPTEHYVSELGQPTELQVHRWRYAFVRQPWSDACVSAALPLPISCSGDWCGGTAIEAALISGLEAGLQIDRLLDQKLPIEQRRETRFAELLKPLTQQSV